MTALQTRLHSAIRASLFAAALLFSGVCILSFAGSSIASESRPLGPRAEIAFVDEELESRISVSEPRFRSKGRFPQAEIELKNTTRRNINIQYKIEWRDTDGFKIDTQSAWHGFLLQPNKPEYIQTVGKRDTAYSFIISIRRHR